MTQYPYTPLVKFGEMFAPEAMARTSIRPAHPRETWLQALDRVTAPPDAAASIFGMPVMIDDRVPTDEIWLVGPPRIVNGSEVRDRARITEIDVEANRPLNVTDGRDE